MEMSLGLLRATVSEMATSSFSLPPPSHRSSLVRARPFSGSASLNESHSPRSKAMIWNTGPSIDLNPGLASAQKLSCSGKEQGGDKVTSFVFVLAMRDSRCW